ncbi:DUF3073 domain-containing protein [Hoyosella rhizosphaerae]|uniref:DUF3073 domain-containing protein n=1 Tax=Hoyosella rhizosphaerae TaxID=1755582 RepID=A0A916XIT1_9ACTN|nr:DUF3073 domain-containing protein [Hoyosella rhizosphaerae]MBN4928254.1 DUF3073 domain-containing protein [Hoyosella rhizosphaerae]GGC73580.1 hypothetical protein GCM10011410_28410 [Hoyosella rhizosphaerae]
MGRGRAKAKQTKVARALKYSSPNTDFERLQQELSGATSHPRHDDSLTDDPYEPDYSRWVDDDDYQSWSR